MGRNVLKEAIKEANKENNWKKWQDALYALSSSYSNAHVYVNLNISLALQNIKLINQFGAEITEPFVIYIDKFHVNGNKVMLKLNGYIMKKEEFVFMKKNPCDKITSNLIKWHVAGNKNATEILEYISELRDVSLSDILINGYC